MSSFDSKKHIVDLVICTGTACYIMGGSEILLVEESLAPAIKGRVNVSGSPCLGHCRHSGDPNKQGPEGNHTPCVVINGTLHSGVDIGDVLRLVQEACDALEQ